ncbi:MAG: esterase-like activity of phytase family protein [Rubrivivax sp.]|nr:esterase-like activity of phytase family protein [Rubrivivax sp.]
MKLHLSIAVLAVSTLALPSQAQTLTYIGQQHVATGTLFAGTTVGGLSSIDWNARTNSYLAISDDRSTVNPARFYSLTLDLAQFRRSAAPGSAGIGFTGVTTILTPAGSPYAANAVDPEGLRFDAQRGLIYWSNEGDRNLAVPRIQDPTVQAMRLDGTHVRDFAVPSLFGTSLPNAGIRQNLAFESLAITPDGKTLWTATENALVQDGAAASTTAGSPSRLLSFNLETGAPGAQHVYNVGPVGSAPNPAGGFATNGLTDFLALGDGRFVTIERAFAAGAQTPGVGPNGLPTGNTIRLYLADVAGATDVSALASLAGQTVSPMSKTLLLDLSDLRNDDGSALALDNIEGITLGPEFEGKPTLLLVSDNNFSGAQFTQFVALQISAPIPEPAAWALMLTGLPLLGASVWVRRWRATAGHGAA